MIFTTTPIVLTVLYSLAAIPPLFLVILGIFVACKKKEKCKKLFRLATGASNPFLQETIYAAVAVGLAVNGEGWAQVTVAYVLPSIDWLVSLLIMFQALVLVNHWQEFSEHPPKMSERSSYVGEISFGILSAILITIALAVGGPRTATYRSLLAANHTIYALNAIWVVYLFTTVRTAASHLSNENPPIMAKLFPWMISIFLLRQVLDAVTAVLYDPVLVRDAPSALEYFTPICNFIIFNMLAAMVWQFYKKV